MFSLYFLMSSTVYPLLAGALVIAAAGLLALRRTWRRAHNWHAIDEPGADRPASPATQAAAKKLGFLPAAHRLVETGPYSGAWVWAPAVILGTIGGASDTTSKRYEIILNEGSERRHIWAAGGRVLPVIDPRGDALFGRHWQAQRAAEWNSDVSRDPFTVFAERPDELLATAEDVAWTILDSAQYAAAKDAALAACANGLAPTLRGLIDAWRLQPALQHFAEALDNAIREGQTRSEENSPRTDLD